MEALALRYPDYFAGGRVVINDGVCLKVSQLRTLQWREHIAAALRVLVPGAEPMGMARLSRYKHEHYVRISFRPGAAGEPARPPVLIHLFHDNIDRSASPNRLTAAPTGSTHALLSYRCARGYQTSRRPCHTCRCDAASLHVCPQRSRPGLYRVPQSAGALAAIVSLYVTHLPVTRLHAS